jgi:hypothetical protein
MYLITREESFKERAIVNRRQKTEQGKLDHNLELMGIDAHFQSQNL